MASTELTVKITPNDKGNPPGKLAEAELHFTGSPLDGLRLIGFRFGRRGLCMTRKSRGQGCPIHQLRERKQVGHAKK
jgi:hypothetical protein